LAFCILTVAPRRTSLQQTVGAVTHEPAMLDVWAGKAEEKWHHTAHCAAHGETGTSQTLTCFIV